MNKIIFAVLILSSFLVSCFSEREPQVDSNARLEVFLIDAPADFQEVWVEVVAVELLFDGGNEGNANDWFSMPYLGDDREVNLLELTGGNSLRLGEIELPAGEITQIRLILGDNNYLVKDDQQIPLSTPSAQQSGLKVPVNKTLTAGASHDLVIDFDVFKSIVQAGASGQYILKPNLRILPEEYATIDGVILPLDAWPVSVVAVTGQDSIGTFVDTNGYFKIQGLEEATYTIVVTPNQQFNSYVSEPFETVMRETKSAGSIELERIVTGED
ncbi:MAG TPA: DUF4382 domain-containing protein [Lunatimonas sp.]|nr:DUF4382 domain-containing protein [Lunatimonas sp.]